MIVGDRGNAMGAMQGVEDKHLLQMEHLNQYPETLCTDGTLKSIPTNIRYKLYYLNEYPQTVVTDGTLKSIPTNWENVSFI